MAGDKILIDKARIDGMLKQLNMVDGIFDNVPKEFNFKPVSRYDREYMSQELSETKEWDRTINRTSNLVSYHHVTTMVTKDFHNEGFYKVQTTMNSSIMFTTNKVPLERIKEAKSLHEARIDYAAVFAMVEAPRHSAHGTIIELPELVTDPGKGMGAALAALLKERGIL